MITANDPNNKPVLKAALQARDAGISTIPISADGSKRPALLTWDEHKTNLPNFGQIKKWFGNGHEYGLAIIGGAVSGNLEGMDFDNREYYTLMKEAAFKAGLADLVNRIENGYLEYSPKGVHWFYRCPEGVEGSTKLARRVKRDEDGNPVLNETGKPEIEVLIETKGEGGYVIVAPSGGRVHPSGQSYRVIKGDLSTIATITREERDQLLTLARTFNELDTDKHTQQAKKTTTKTEVNGTRPGDDFNARTTWEGLLEPEGWRRLWTDSRDVTYWRRPGKHLGISATTNFGGADLLYVFTTSTEFESETTYSKFAAYAVIHHGGDMKAAARELVSKGYGDKKIGFKPFLGSKIVDPETGEILEESDDSKPKTDYSDLRALTDYGNAERLVDLFGNNVRYCFEQEWLVWTGKRWAEDKSGQIMRYAKETVRRIYGEAEDTEDTTLRKKIAAHALNSEKKERLRAMIELAKDEAGIPVRNYQLDTDPMLFNVLNGTVDLSTGKLREHTREDLITKQSTVKFVEGAGCPLWLEFLNRIFHRDNEMIRFIQQSVGYSMTGSIVEQVFFLLYGTGSNGKSTFLEILKTLLGDYAKATSFTTFLEKQGDSIRNDLAGLAGARFVVAKEAKSGKGFDESVMKELTGGDTISARFLRKEYFEYKPTFKIWLAANHKPRIKEQSLGIWRRVRLIPFEVQIPEDEADRDFSKKLEAELPGILNWAIEGCLEWQRQGRLVAPQRVKDATEAYKSESDRLREFIQENCITGKAQKHFVPLADLHKAYTSWCRDSDEHPLGKMSFRSALEERGYPSGNGTGNKVTVYGISLVGYEN